MEMVDVEALDAGPLDTEALDTEVVAAAGFEAPSSEWPQAQPDPEPAAMTEPRDVADAIDVVSVEAPGSAPEPIMVESDDAGVPARSLELGAAAPAEDPAVAEPDPAATSVDSLFARIRADRAAAVQQAHEVLAEPEGAAANGTAEAAGSPAPASAERGSTVSDADEALLQRRDETVGAIEVALTRRLKRALQDEQNDLLDRLRGMRPRPTAAKVLPTRSEHAARFADASRPFLGEAASAGAVFIGTLIGRPVTGDEGLEELDVLADNLAGAIVAPLRRRLEEVLMDTEDDDRVALAESFGAAYREWKTQRIELTAADHVASAFAGGAFAATPTGTRLRWLVEDTDGPCPDCDDNVLAGPLPKGERFPTGQRHPPAHSGCRCLLVPKT